ncbi:MAG: hypothetical protein JNK05_00225 [Myxococcales bacterium]|nr:hypothetical protein [Myxococcales bacterium]
MTALNNAPAAPTPSQRSALETPLVGTSPLQPGDVLVFGVYGDNDRGAARCSDLVACLNVWSRAVRPELLSGLGPAWACHAAIYAGDGVLLHASGPGWDSFVLEADNAVEYLAKHQRMTTVLRCRDRAVAAHAGAIARAVSRHAGSEKVYGAARLLWQMLQIAVAPGRDDDALLRGLERAIEGDRSCFDSTDALITCSGLVSTILHLAARNAGEARAIEGVPCQVPPYDLCAALLAHPRWRTVASVQAPGLRRPFALPEAPAQRARTFLARHPALLLASTTALCATLAGLFELGIGKLLARWLLDGDRRPVARPAGSPRSARRGGIA